MNQPPHNTNKFIYICTEFIVISTYLHSIIYFKLVFNESVCISICIYYIMYNILGKDYGEKKKHFCSISGYIMFSSFLSKNDRIRLTNCFDDFVFLKFLLFDHVSAEAAFWESAARLPSCSLWLEVPHQPAKKRIKRNH